MSLHVSKNERGMVRVFSLSMSDEDARALSTSKDPAALGLATLDPAFIEVFAVSDLEQLGIPGYLESGCGVPRAAIDPDRAKLSQLDGWVLIVFSRAFDGVETTLQPIDALTLIGTYAEPGADWSATKTLTSQSAEGSAAPARKAPSDAAMSGRIATLVLVVIFALTGVLVWIAA